MDRKRHWETIYQTKTAGDMSWTQPEPVLSLQLILQAAPPPNGRILDAGGGSSALVDRLLDWGYIRPEVLDLSGAALAVSRQRLGARAELAAWHEGDVLGFQPSGPYDLWHDRAVYHFLIDPEDRRVYQATVERSLRVGGHLVLATFAPEGPEQCSKLPVQRWDADRLMAEWGAGWKLLSENLETHVTPWGKPQKFRYFLVQRG